MKATIIAVDDNGDARFRNHPLHRIRESAEERVFASLLLPALFVRQRLADGLIRFQVRGQSYSDWSVARRMAGGES